MSGYVAVVLLLAMGIPHARVSDGGAVRRLFGGGDVLLVAGGILIVLASLDGQWSETHVQHVRLTVTHKSMSQAGDVTAYTVQDASGRKFGTSESLWSELRVGDHVACEVANALVLADTLETCELPQHTSDTPERASRERH